MLQGAISGNHETRYPIAETLWVVAGILLLLAFGDVLTFLVLAFAVVAMAAAWWIHRSWRLPTSFRGGTKGYLITMLLSFIFAATALAATLTLAAPVQAAMIDTRLDICSALRNGTSLASIETTLEARGYTASNAGALTGTTIRQQCPDQAAGVMAQLARQRGSKSTCHHYGVSAAIWVILILLAIGIVVESLVRLRTWLNNSPPIPGPKEPPEDDA